MKRTGESIRYITMIFILDFDGVLFDDKRFKRDFQHIFGDYGVSHDAYKHTYLQAKNDKKGIYELQIHLRILQGKYPDIHLEYLRRDVMALASRAERYLFPDAKGFLHRSQKKGNIFFLLSTGDPHFQEVKINASGITPMFTRVIITSSFKKAQAFGEIIKDAGRKEIMFVDDKKEVADEIKQRYPAVRVIQMTRSGRVEKSDLADGRVKDFSDKIFT